MGKIGQLLSHPDEVMPLVRMYMAARKITRLPREENLAFCYSILNNVSRSFAIVIQELPNPLKDAICVFYLVLRALDTVEDDMAIPISEKLPEVLTFHEKLYDRTYSKDCGYNHYKVLMQQFQKVVAVFLGLDKVYQDVIQDITQKMGAGMAKYLEKEVETLEDLDEYCYYVAGLVGVGLTKMFVVAGLQSKDILEHEELSVHMGRFLQKTNIIRDYLEDITEIPAPRMYWPRAVWSKYAPSLATFKEPSERAAAIKCLNHLIADAMRHVPYVLDYMERMEHPQTFRFVAIPQVMAAHTLALCYNNGKVFEGAVKMRRGQTAKIFDTCNSYYETVQWMDSALEVLHAKVQDTSAAGDPTARTMSQAVIVGTKLCDAMLKKHTPPKRGEYMTLALFMAVLFTIYCFILFVLDTIPSGPLRDTFGPVFNFFEWQPNVQKAIATVMITSSLITMWWCKR